jgi:hypothetical protein
MFQATRVPNAFGSVTMILRRKTEMLAHEQTANLLHRVFFSGISPRFGVKILIHRAPNLPLARRPALAAKPEALVEC